MRSSDNLDDSIEVIHDRPVQIDGDKLVNKVSFKENHIEVDGVFVIKIVRLQVHWFLEQRLMAFILKLTII